MKEWILIVYATFSPGDGSNAISLSPEDFGFNSHYENKQECLTASKLINVTREIEYQYEYEFFGKGVGYNTQEYQIVHGKCLSNKKPE
jgi:hypothetical protein